MSRGERNRKITSEARRTPALSALAFSVVGASCALTFPDYELESSTGTASGGAGGDALGAAGSGSSPDGASCSANDECENGSCLPSNTGESSVCCATACPDSGAASCATNGKCDAGGTGCALYPAGTVCGETTTCEAGMLTSMQCKTGSCAESASPCSGGLACEDGSACKAECASSADCVNPGAECPDGQCVQPAGAPCDANDQCMSGVCGTTGTGHCCSAACDPIGEPCGATDCDDAGACVFPGEETPCGEDSSCMNAKLTSDSCDGMGACASGSSQQPCPGHLACESETSCYEECGSNDATGDAHCAAGYWCDGSACQVAAWQGGAACTRNRQCCSGDCTPIGCYLWTPCG